MFAIQSDEIIEVTNFAGLLVSVSYLNNNEVKENLLLCHVLSKRTTSEDVFNAIDCYFKKKRASIDPIVMEYVLIAESKCRVYILVFEVAS